jgi:hypothetical protein
MTPAEMLPEKLDKWMPAHSGLNEWAGTIAGCQVKLLAEQNGPIGIRLFELFVVRPAATDGTTKAWAERVAANAAGLLEPLALHEADEADRIAMLRSAKPTQQGELVFYYELKLRNQSQASIRRFQANTETMAPRQAITFDLTHEVLTNLVAALSR